MNKLALIQIFIFQATVLLAIIIINSNWYSKLSVYIKQLLKIFYIMVGVFVASYFPDPMPTAPLVIKIAFALLVGITFGYSIAKLNIQNCSKK